MGHQVQLLKQNVYQADLSQSNASSLTGSTASPDWRFFSALISAALRLATLLALPGAGGTHSRGVVSYLTVSSLIVPCRMSLRSALYHSVVTLMLPSSDLALSSMLHTLSGLVGS